MVQKNIIFFTLLLLAFSVLLSGCSGNEKSAIKNFYLSLMGDSQTWKLTGYEIVITPESFKAGNGTLTMKNKEEYMTDFFHFETHVMMNDEDTVVHAGSISGAGTDIAEELTGSIDGGTYLNKDGCPITWNEVSTIYMIVKWWDTDKRDRVTERIDLYSKANREDTFLQ